jgi:8-oxo-dGTP pyrophosphatase MutT (NUDIX family)
MKTNKEILDIVDDNDNVIGQDSRDNHIKKGFRVRNVAINIIDENNRIIFGKRASSKQVSPNKYDLVAGYVNAGEDCLTAAKREVKEEFGIDCALQPLTTWLNTYIDNGLKLNFMTHVFVGIHYGEIFPNEEFSKIKRIPLKEVANFIKNNPHQFVPPLVTEFEAYKDQLQSIIFN